MDRTPAVYLELLFRPGVRDEFRREALAALAKQDKRPELEVLVSAIKAHDESAATEESVGFDLARLLSSRPRADLVAGRAGLEALATTGRTTTTRQMGYVALVAADGDVEKAWAQAVKSAPALQDFVSAAPMVRGEAVNTATTYGYDIVTMMRGQNKIGIELFSGMCECGVSMFPAPHLQRLSRRTAHRIQNFHFQRNVSLTTHVFHEFLIRICVRPQAVIDVNRRQF